MHVPCFSVRPIVNASGSSMLSLNQTQQSPNPIHSAPPANGDTANTSQASAALQARGVQLSLPAQPGPRHTVVSIDSSTTESLSSRGVSALQLPASSSGMSHLNVESRSMTPSLSEFSENERSIVSSIVDSNKSSLEKNHPTLGKGAFGEVFHVTTGKGSFAPNESTIAFKSSNTESGAESLVLEAKVYERLDSVGPCENIIKSYGIQEIEGAQGLALEFVDGCEVSELLGVLENLKDSGSIKHSEYWGAIQHLTKGMLTALEHVKQAGLSHNDIKGGNMLYDKESGVLKLFDFGGVTNLGEDETRFYTPNYAAPEALMTSTQETDDITVSNPKQDSFSVGQMVYRTGEGENHFFGSDTNSAGGFGLALDLADQLDAIKDAGEFEHYETLKELKTIEQVAGPGFYGIGGGHTAYVDFINSATKLEIDPRKDPSELLQMPFITDPLNSLVAEIQEAKREDREAQGTEEDW